MVFYIIIFIFLLVLLGIPIAFSFGFGSLVYCMLVNIDTIIIPQRIFVSTDKFTFLAIPFFLLVGNLMNVSGVTHRILNLANNLVGHIKGGLGHTNVVASMIFAGLSGSAIADAAGLGAVEIEMMRKGGYDDDFSASITLASSIIGPIIPPSIIMVIYGMVASVSIGRMLLGGLFPGIVMGLCLMVMVYFMAIIRNYPHNNWAGWKKIFQSFYGALLPLLTPLIIIIGIVSGIFTPTEAGAVAALYTFLLGIFVFKKINWKNFKSALIDTAMTTALIGIIIGVSGIFSWIITIEGIPRQLVQFIMSLTSNKIVILLLINLVVLILGCFIDAAPLILLLVPVLLPLLNMLNIDLIHFGIIISINSMIGTITPPVGTCLYAVSSVSGLPIERLARSVIPFLVMLIIALLIITFIPQISLWFPNLILG
jgi:tripartite ATP-independent transporter DctM subunit